MMDKFSIANRDPQRENQTGKMRNANYRRNQPHIKQRDLKGPDI